LNDVIPFPDANRSPGDVFCEPMGIFFPRLYRLDLPDRHLYTLSPAATPCPHGTKISRAHSLFSGDRFSIVVRRHGSMNAADAYLGALRDMEIAGRSDVVSQTDQGCFTLVQRPTKPRVRTR
jgi:hypothetical protein